MEIRIIEIEEKDREKYIEFSEKFYNMDTVLHKVPTKNFENTFNHILNSNIYAEAFMIKENENYIGYALISKTYSQEVASMVLLVEEIYIEEEYRNKGIGTLIFNFLHKKFKNYKRFRLEVVKENLDAIKLYKKLGYKFLDYLQMVKEEE